MSQSRAPCAVEGPKPLCTADTGRGAAPSIDRTKQNNAQAGDAHVRRESEPTTGFEDAGARRSRSRKGKPQVPLVAFSERREGGGRAAWEGAPFCV